jgi:hypothetical protein
MMNYVVIFYLELAFLCWLFFWAYHDYRVDLLRYRIFVARDRLFQYAEEGKIRFDDPAYMLTRTFLNGGLRFAHRMTMSNLFFAAFLQKKINPQGGEHYHAKLEQSLHGLSFEQKKLINGIHSDAHFAIMRHIVNISPIFFLAAWPLKMAYKWHLLHKRFTKNTRKKIVEPIDAVIYDIGNQDTCEGPPAFC